MARRLAAAVLAGFTAMLLTSSAQSSGCCDETPRWTVANAVFTGYDNSVVAVPGNDTRVNLLLLLADRHGTALPAPAQATPGEGASPDTPAPFFQWSALRGGSGYETDVPGCARRGEAAQAFQTALASDSRIPATEKRALVAVRQAMESGCESGESAPAIDMAAIGQSDFATYLRGAKAFYAASFDEAGSSFARLGTASNPWMKETALYMVARASLNRAQATAFDDYGSLAEAAKRDQAAISAAGRAFQAYLTSYPSGRYADSARGLMRRVYWLAGDRTKLAGEYARLFAVRDPARRGLDDMALAQEIDNKLLMGQTDSASDAPALLAVVDLMRMRGSNPLYGADNSAEKPIARSEIEAQRAKFADDTPLFEFILASHDFYVGRRPAEVLRIIPDAARQPKFSSIQFSRQMLRGFALDATRDPNARGFWLELINGTSAGYQRQAVELALAMHEERNGGLARAFAPNSQIRDPNIRGILLGYGASPELLRQQATDARAPKAEREAALFILLAKQLGRGLYGGFANDVRLVPVGAPAAAGDFQAVYYRGTRYGEGRPPVGLFSASKSYGDFGCPPLRDVAAQLAKAPRASKPLMCLAEFFRTAGFDYFELDRPPPKDELGGAPSLFPGKPFSRLETYKIVIADAAAAPADKAYALYRAVRCYAPSGNNDCGGVEVDKAQRRAWFQRLKRDYPQSSWAKSSDLYW